jgi:hypothetical protein
VGAIGSHNTAQAAGLKTPTLVNETIAVASTEQSYAFPSGTKYFVIRNRSSYLIQYTYTALASGTTFRTLYPGELYCLSGTSLSSQSLYFQSPGAGGILEIESWA